MFVRDDGIPIAFEFDEEKVCELHKNPNIPDNAVFCGMIPDLTVEGSWVYVYRTPPDTHRLDSKFFIAVSHPNREEMTYHKASKLFSYLRIFLL